jgi:hypothetical protein
MISTIENIETIIWILLMTWTYIQFFDSNSIIRNIVQTIKSFIYLGFQLLILVTAFAIILVMIYAKDGLTIQI